MAAMPRPTFSPTVSPRTLDSLVSSLRKFQEDEQEVRREYPWADRFAMGVPLAPWQREFKWTEEQSRRFITSAWTGIHLGTYVVVAMDLRNDVGHDRVEHAYLSDCVIEGQQRLKSLELYFTDCLAVPDVDGAPTLWSEVDLVEQRRFRNVVFSRGELREHDEAKLRHVYDLMNFGGVAHEESERAEIPRPGHHG